MPKKNLNSRTVLYLCGSSALGGVETFLLHTAQFHDRNLWNPIYVLLQKDGPLVDQLKGMNVPVCVVPNEPRLRYPWSVLKTAKWIAKIADEYHVHIIHSCMAYGAIFGSVASTYAGCSHIWFQHGPVETWQDSLAARLPHQAILVNSKYTFDRQLVRTPKHSRDQITVIHPGVTPPPLLTSFKNIPGQYKTNSIDEMQVILLGRIQPFKGCNLFCRAIIKASEQVNGKIRGVLVGGAPSPDKYETQVRSLVASHPDILSIVNRTPNPGSWLERSDVMVNASLFPEGLGLTLLEAMAARKLVIAPNAGGPLDFMIHRQNGLLFEMGSLDALVKTLLEAYKLKQKGTLKDLTDKAYQTYLNGFTAEASIHKLENFYETI